MTIFLFFQITFVCLLGAMSPGPSMIVVINNAIFKNKVNGIITALGHGLGIGIYASFAVLGIGIVIQTNLMLFNLLKIISIFFLFYMGIQAILKRNQLEFKQNNIAESGKSFFQGLSISILNPKILIWFIAIYSQFMSLNNDIYFNLWLILIASIVDALWYILLVNLVTLKGVHDQIKRNLQFMRKIIGFLFLLISIILIVDLVK